MKTAETQWVGLMVLDVNMPGLNGFEVLRAVKQSRVLKKMRVRMVTARSDEVDKALGLQLGVEVYVMKPLSPLARLGEASRHSSEA